MSPVVADGNMIPVYPHLHHLPPPYPGHQYPHLHGSPYPPSQGSPYPPSQGSPYPPSQGSPYPPSQGSPYPGSPGLRSTWGRRTSSKYDTVRSVELDSEWNLSHSMRDLPQTPFKRPHIKSVLDMWAQSLAGQHSSHHGHQYQGGQALWERMGHISARSASAAAAHTSWERTGKLSPDSMSQRSAPVLVKPHHKHMSEREYKVLTLPPRFAKGFHQHELAAAYASANSEEFQRKIMLLHNNMSQAQNTRHRQRPPANPSPVPLLHRSRSTGDITADCFENMRENFPLHTAFTLEMYYNMWNLK